MTSPLFIVIEPSGADACAAAKRIAWACEAERSEARRKDFAKAAARIAALARAHPLHLADPLFDAPRLQAIFAAAGLAAPEGRDWLLALAPFGQARNLAAILEAAKQDNPAVTLLEAWRAARAKAGGG